MKTLAAHIIALAMLASSCSQPKAAEQSNALFPISAVSIDTLSVDPNGIVFMRIRTISPLPERFVYARPEVRRVEGDTIVFWKKYMTAVPDSLKSQVGRYEVIFKEMNSIAVRPKQVLKLQYWRDSVSTIDTVIHIKQGAV